MSLKYLFAEQFQFTFQFIKQCEEEDYDASKVSPYSTTIEAAHQKILDYYHEGHGGLLHTYIFTRIYQMYKLINEKG